MDTAIHGGNLAVSGSMQERHGGTGRTRQAAFAAVGCVSLLLAVLLGWLSLQGEGGGSRDNDAAVLRHERETLLARQLEQFSCIRQARVQLAPQSWQSGAVIVLEPARPEAMPDAAALERMLDSLALIPDAPDKRHVLVFDTEGRRLYPDHETDETARREQEVALERQALRVLRPLLEGNGRAEVLVSLDGAEKENGRTTGRRTISVLLEENAVPGTVRPHLESLLGQACALEEGRGDALRICFLPARRNAAVLRGLALIFAVLALAGMAAFFRACRQASGPSAGPEVRFEEKLPCEAARDSKAAEDAESLRRQLETSLREHPGQGVALLRHWLTQEDTTPEGTAGGRESCN